MSPAAQLASLVDDHLSRGNSLDPVIAAVVTGLAEICRAFMHAQSKSSDWAGMLASLRSGTEQLRIGIEGLREQSGFEGLVKFAERHSAFATAMIEEIARLQAEESTLV